MWTFKAPPKPLNLVWRAVTSCLPTKTQLQTKHVQIDNTCPVCGCDIESIMPLAQGEVATTCWNIFSTNIVTLVNMYFLTWLKERIVDMSNNAKTKVKILC